MSSPSITRYRDISNIIDMPRMKVIDPSTGIVIREYPTKQGDRLLTLAALEYGNSGYWWILAEINDIIEKEIIFGKFDAKVKLLIPDAKILEEIKDVSDE